MGDPWFGHRNPLTGEPIGDRDEMTSWDYSLANAFQTIEDYTDEYGMVVWEREDEYAIVNADRKVHPFLAARDSKVNGKNYKPSPGEYFIPSVKSRRSGGKLQTYSEWVKAEIEKAKGQD